MPIRTTSDRRGTPTRIGLRGVARLRNTPRRFAIVALIGVTVVGSCVVARQLRPSARQSLGVAALRDAFHIQGGATAVTDYDRLVRLAFSDIEDFWQQAYPTVSGGRSLKLPTGGIWSVQTGRPDPAESCMAEAPTAVDNNSFYCPDDDAFAYDRIGLPSALVPKLGRNIVPLVFAHEFGHLVQSRLGVDLTSIQRETQADCASGAFVAAEAGASPIRLATRQFHFHTQNLDIIAIGMMLMRDYSPHSSMDDGSHGNGFDRVGAFFEGYRNGVARCYNPDWAVRKFTERSYDSVADQTQHGNETIAQVLNSGTTGQGGGGLEGDLNKFWAQTFRPLHKSFRKVHITAATTPPCARNPVVQFAYCPADNTVYYSPRLVAKVYNSVPMLNGTGATVKVDMTAPGDFALGALLAYGWAMSVRHQLGLSLGDATSLISSSCYVGAYARKVNAQNHTQFALSPQDMDEAAITVLRSAALPATFGGRNTTGLERIAAFNHGYLGGMPAC